MSEAFDDVGGDGALELEPVTASEIDYDRRGRALVRIRQLGDARVVYASVALSAEDARSLANALIEIAEANGA